MHEKVTLGTHANPVEVCVVDTHKQCLYGYARGEARGDLYWEMDYFVMNPLVSQPHS